MVPLRSHSNKLSTVYSLRGYPFWDTSAGIGKLFILGHLELVLIWSCFVSCLLFLLFYVSLGNLCSSTCRKIHFLQVSLFASGKDLAALYFVKFLNTDWLCFVTIEDRQVQNTGHRLLFWVVSVLVTQ